MSLLGSFVMGATLVLAATLAPPARAASPADSSGEFVYCMGKYALCDRAPCKPILRTDKRSDHQFVDVVCSCSVETGWSVGPLSCADRQPVSDKGLTFLISTYSNRFNEQEKTLTCNDPETVWANCYGAPCVVDPADPKQSACTCPVSKTPMATLGGNCLQQSCDAIWSAAPIALDKVADAQFYAYLKANAPDYPVRPPAQACPVTAQ